MYTQHEKLQKIACISAISHHGSSVRISVGTPLRRGHAEVIQCLCEAEAGGNIHENGGFLIKVWTKNIRQIHMIKLNIKHDHVFFLVGILIER